MVTGTVSLMLREPLVQLRMRSWREPSALALDTQSKPAIEHGTSKQRAPGRERRPNRRRTSCARAQLTPSTSTSATVSWPGGWPGEAWIVRGAHSRAELAGRAGASPSFGDEPQPATSPRATTKTERMVQRNRAAAYRGRDDARGTGIASRA